MAMLLENKNLEQTTLDVIPCGKRQHDSKMMTDIKCLLLDIEGTTTSISFVKDVLFPYARENLSDFLVEKWGTEDLNNDIQLLSLQAVEDVKTFGEEVPTIDTTGSKEDVVRTVQANVKWQMDRDRKTTALKQLQGHIWREGYYSGKLKGHVYDDVLEALQVWTSSDKQVYIYSSGSVEAQKLLFGHSSFGDLLKYLSGHFDTLMGAKTQAASYTAIASSIGVPPLNILFLTDILGEAEAAREAGLKTAIMLRPGNSAIAADKLAEFPSFANFNGLK